MAEMTEEVKQRLRAIQEARRAERQKPGRGTLRGMDPLGWNGSLDAIAEGHPAAEEATAELVRAHILVPYVDGQHVPPGSRHRVRLTYARQLADGEIRVEPRRVEDSFNNPRTTDWAYLRWARLYGITTDREADMKRTLGGRTVTVGRNRGPNGVVMEPTRFYPADQIAVLFRLMWFATAEDRLPGGKPWAKFREAFYKYVILYTDSYAVANKLEMWAPCERCSGSGEIQAGGPPSPSWYTCEACNGRGQVPANLSDE